MKLVKYSKIIGIKMNIEIDNVIENISTEQKFKMNVMEASLSKYNLKNF